MIDALKLALLYAITILVHWFCANHCTFFGIGPDVALVVAAAVGAFSGSFFGYAFAYMCGFYLDFIGAGMFGGYCLAFTLMVYVITIFRRRVDIGSMASRVIVSVVATVFVIIIYGLAGLAFEHRMLWNGWLYFIFVPVINGLISPVVFYLVEMLAPEPGQSYSMPL